MKSFLPKTIKNPRGFTLIELMVVISIIAFLAVIGIAAFSQTQKQARDGRRRADIDAIAKAMESSFDPIKGSYVTLDRSMFSTGAFPVDPSTTTAYTAPLTPSGCTSGTNCPGFYTCATLEITTQGNSSTNNGTITPTGTLTYYCRLSQLSK